MKPITVEFSVRQGDQVFKEDSVTFENAEALFDYIAPGGYCENMPSDLDEIQMIFQPAGHFGTGNPLADKHVTLQLGIVFFTGPLSVIVPIAQELMARSERAQLSPAFLAAVGAANA